MKLWDVLFYLARLFCLIASPLTYLFYKGLRLVSTYKTIASVNQLTKVSN